MAEEDLRNECIGSNSLPLFDFMGGTFVSSESTQTPSPADLSSLKEWASELRLSVNFSSVNHSSSLKASDSANVLGADPPKTGNLAFHEFLENGPTPHLFRRPPSPSDLSPLWRESDTNFLTLRPSHAIFPVERVPEENLHVNRNRNRHRKYTAREKGKAPISRDD